MIQLRGRPRFAEELFCLGFARLIVAGNLDRDGPVELCIAGFPDCSKRSDTDLFQQFEVRDGFG